MNFGNRTHVTDKESNMSFHLTKERRTKIINLKMDQRLIMDNQIQRLCNNLKLEVVGKGKRYIHADTYI